MAVILVINIIWMETNPFKLKMIYKKIQIVYQFIANKRYNHDIFCYGTQATIVVHHVSVKKRIRPN